MPWIAWFNSDRLFFVFSFAMQFWMISDTVVSRRQAGPLLVRCKVDSWWGIIVSTLFLLPLPVLPWQIAVTCPGWLGVIWMPLLLGAAEIRENGLINRASFVPWRDVRSAQWTGNNLVWKTDRPMALVITFRVPEASRDAVQSVLTEKLLAGENPKPEGAGSLKANAAD